MNQASSDEADHAGTVVLVHGAGHGGWCWFLVADRLRRAGLRVEAPDLPLTGLEADIQVVRDAIDAARGLGPVTVAAHSMGGVAATAAGHRADRLVFMAAAMPLEGESLAATLSEFAFPAALQCATFAADGSFTLRPEIADYIYSSTPEELRREALTKLRPTGTAFPDEPIPHPAWTSVPSAYVVSRNDRCCPPDWQRGRAALVADSVEIDADHSAFFSAPDELSAILIAQAAKARQSNWRASRGNRAGGDPAESQRSAGAAAPH
jgi:pimeloyl-ACP methyl ester carboxylesterase